MEGEIGHTLPTPLGAHFSCLLWGRSRSASLLRGHQNIGYSLSHYALVYPLHWRFEHSGSLTGVLCSTFDGPDAHCLSTTSAHSPNPSPPCRTCSTGVPCTARSCISSPQPSHTSQWPTLARFLISKTRACPGNSPQGMHPTLPI